MNYIDSTMTPDKLVEISRIKDELFIEYLQKIQTLDTEYNTLEYPETCITEQKYKPKDDTDYYKVFFDFETITNEDTHKPYLVRFETEDNEQKEFIGENCAIDMLNNLPDKKKIMLIAHNANYDCRFLLNHLSHEKPIVKSGRFLSVDSVFYRYCDKHQPIKIKIKDSCKIIQMPSNDFGKSFKLDVHKEVMPYKSTQKRTLTEFISQYLKQYNISMTKMSIHLSTILTNGVVEVKVISSIILTF